MVRISRMNLLLAALFFALSGSAAAQTKIVAAPAPVAVVPAVPGAAARPNLLSPSVLRLQSRIDVLRSLAPDAHSRFLRHYFENSLTAGEPAIPAGRAPKAKPIVFKDLVLQRANFSEDVKISAILVALIDRADTTLDLSLHGLSLPDVAQALLRARERGVKVRIIMNHSHTFPEREGQKVSAEVQFLLDQKFDMRTLRGGGPFGVMHNKIIIVDSKVLKLGSFNWTKAADTKNFENAVFFDQTAKIARYQKRFEDHWAAARPVSQGPMDAWPLDGKGIAGYASEETVEYNGERFPEDMESPKGGVEAALLKAINASRKEIAVAMFSLTSDPIVEALVAAQARGVKVRMVVDRSQGVGRAMAADVKKLMDGGIDLVWASGHQPGGVMHNKFAVFDRKMLEVGSFNWTNNAEHNNYENANFTLEPELIQDFLEEFEYIYNAGTRPTKQEAARIEQLIEAGFFDPFKPAESETLPR